MTNRNFLRAVAGTVAALAMTTGCERRMAPAITRVAEYYVERYADSVAVADSLTDSLKDSAASLSRIAVIDSLTRAWTLDDWNDFWSEVHRLREP
jgi:hypothetical protein